MTAVSKVQLPPSLNGSQLSTTTMTSFVTYFLWIHCHTLLTSLDVRVFPIARLARDEFKVRPRFVVWALQKTEQPILLVENNPDDVLLVLRAFQRASVSRPVQVVTSGMDALAYVQGALPYDDREKHPLPAMVLLDIRMPGMDGFEVLRWIRGQFDFAHLCVVMLTSSDNIHDANQAYRLGANSFLVKPLDFENAGELARSLDTLLASKRSQRTRPVLSP